MDAVIRAWQLLQASKHLNPISLAELKSYDTLEKLLDVEHLDEEAREECIQAVLIIETLDEEQESAKDDLLQALQNYVTDRIEPVVVVHSKRIIPLEVFVYEDPEAVSNAEPVIVPLTMIVRDFGEDVDG